MQYFKIQIFMNLITLTFRWPRFIKDGFDKLNVEEKLQTTVSPRSSWKLQINPARTAELEYTL